MPSPCLSCHLGKKSKENPVCASCQKRIDRVREIHLKYPTGPTTEDHMGHGCGGVIGEDVFERRHRDLG